METQDCGIIYASQIDWTKRGTIIRFNRLYNSGGYGWDRKTKAWVTQFETYGVYLDDWTSGTQVYGNIVSNTAHGGILIHGGRDNVIENNVIVEGGRLGQMVYSGWPIDHPTAQHWLPQMYKKVRKAGYSKYPLLSTIKDIQTGASMSGNRFIRNIVYYRNKSDSLYCINNHIDFSSTVSDYNIIYHGGSPLRVLLPGEVGDSSWAIWQNKGFDQHSVIADPQFSNITGGDFTLSPDSPALKIGFTPIPYEKIGLYKDPLRASWPIQE